MKTLITIMAHGDHGAQKAFDRHLNLWRAHGLPILVMCPEDSQVRTGLQMLLIGKRGHHGEHANLRFKTMLEMLLMLDFDRFIIFEYDSVCLSQAIPAGSKNGVYAIAFNDNREVRSFPGTTKTFEGTLFTHPPLVMNRWTVLEILDAMEELPNDCCLGLWDRYLGYACQIRHIPIHCFRSQGLGYSQNTITSRELPEACDAAAHGAVVFHGIKSKEALEAIVSARQSNIGRLNGYLDHKLLYA